MKRRTAKRLADMAWHQRFVSREVVAMVGSPPFPYATTRSAWTWTQRGNFTKRRTSSLKEQTK